MPVYTGDENLPPPEFDPRTVQTVASRYTDLFSLSVLYLYFFVLTVLTLPFVLTELSQFLYKFYG